MSIKLMSLVWDKYPGGGSELIVFLKLADWAHDNGDHIFPSVSIVGEFSRLQTAQARRRIHSLRDDGWIEPVKNELGGKPGTTTHYRINVKKLRDAPYVGPIIEERRATRKGTPLENETAPSQDRDGSLPGEGRATSQGSLSVTYPLKSVKTGAADISKEDQDQNHKLAEWIYSQVLIINPHQAEPNYKTWETDLYNLKLTRNVTDKEISKLFQFATKHDFWFKHILSPADLANKWDKLTIEKSYPKNSAREKAKAVKLESQAQITEAAKRLKIKPKLRETWPELAARCERRQAEIDQGQNKQEAVK